MVKTRLVALALTSVFLVAGCGLEDDGTSDVPTPEAQDSDPAIPSEIGHIELSWEGPQGDFTRSMEEGDFEPPNGGSFTSSGAVLQRGERVAQLDMKWVDPNEQAPEEDLDSIRWAINFGLEQGFTIEPGTYEVTKAQPDDGSPWFNGSNDPELRYSSTERWYGNSVQGLLTIEEVNDENMTGTLVITGDFLSNDGTFRLAVGFNADAQ